MHRFRSRSLVVAWLFASALTAQSPGPSPTPMPPAIDAPADTPYPGTLYLSVDATDTARHIVQVRETVPVEAGDLTLLYPEWLPGNHSPSGPISKLGGLVVTANGKRIDWVRDRVNVFAFHLTVPAGVKTIDVAFQYLAPIRRTEGRISISDAILDLQWNAVLLYPAGHFSRQITFAPSVKLPEGWKYATALDTE